MALCVSPPPHGFSQARCSSKMATLCPARASCSPHIALEGPPPTIAISAMVKVSPRAWNSAPCRGIPASGPLAGGKDHQTKTSLKYSTEKCCCPRRSASFLHDMHRASLYQIEQRHVHGQQAH